MTEIYGGSVEKTIQIGTMKLLNSDPHLPSLSEQKAIEFLLKLIETFIGSFGIIMLM